MVTKRTFTSHVFPLLQWGCRWSSGQFEYLSQTFLILVGGPSTHVWICWPYRCLPQKKSTFVKCFGHLLLMDIISSFQIEMFHMSDGMQYPNYGVMGFSYDPELRIGRIRLELTGCRVSARVLTRLRQVGGFGDLIHDLFVWDWRTGKKYLVSHAIFLLGADEPYAFVKGAHSNTDRNRSLHRRVPTHWYSSPRLQTRVNAMGYLKRYPKRYPKRFHAPPWTSP